MKPCLVCGEPSPEARCEEHPKKQQNRSKDRSRGAGYGHAWDQLSRRARRLQPWCSDCGTTQQLSADHTPEAWRRHDAGKPIRLKDIAVVCIRCNIARGKARGEGVTRPDSEAAGKPQTEMRMVPKEEGAPW